MKKIILSILIGSCIILSAQEKGVEKSIFGVQTSLLGIWANNESRLTNVIALRSEIGFNTGLFGGDAYAETGFIMTPTINLEPRWYYNLDKRAKKGKNISKNSANYLSLKLGYNPNWFVISNYDSKNYYNSISFVPSWGIKRTVVKHLTYEFGAGLGYIYYFSSESVLNSKGYIALDLHARIGYTF